MRVKVFWFLLLLAWSLVVRAACVSNIAASTPTADFTNNGDGTVTHQRTGLSWMRCSLGQSWVGSTCTGTAVGYTWAGALQAAKSLNDGGGFAGKTDWRLPNLSELESIVEEQCASPMINASIFPNTPATVFWSASAYANNRGDAWLVNFGLGNAGNVTYGKGYPFQARLVRAGQSFSSFVPSATPPSPTFSSLSISCPSSLNEGTSASSACTATATYPNGSTASVTPTWFSFNTSVATISSAGTITAGLVTANSAVTIMGIYTESGVTKSAASSVTVVDVSAVVALSSLGISGGTAQLTSGSSFILTATASYSDGSSKAVTPSWTSNSAAATVNSNSGVVTGNTVSVDMPVTITASYTEGGATRTATYNLTVKAPLTPAVPLSTLSISGGSSVLAAGASMTLTASATYSDNTIRTVAASWSANSTVVTVSSSGQVMAAEVSVNTPVTVTASYTEGGATRTATLNFTVTASTTPRVMSISIQGSNAVPEGGTTTLRVVATYSDASTRSVSANWSSSNPVVSVAATGALAVGQVSADTTVTLTASYTENGATVTQNFALTVKDVAVSLSSINISGPSLIAEGQSTTLTATAIYSDNSSKTVTPIWSSSNSAIASISASGVVTAGQVTADTGVTIIVTYSEAGITKTRLFPIVVKDVAAVVINTTAALATGFSHSVALRSDGSVWSWGWSSLGQSGSGETKTRSVPVGVLGIDSITGISAGAAHNLVLKADGTVWAWGHNGSGGLGDGSTDDRQTPNQVTGVSGVKALAAGLYHSLALKSDGTVVAWGSNSAGQLGDGSQQDRHAPVAVAGLTAVTAIAAGYNSSLAVKSDGTIVAWGDIDGSGRNNLYAPAPISQLSGVRSLAVGWFHTLALKTDGTVWAWGNNAQGQLGDGTTNNRTTPVQVTGLTDVKAIAVGLGHSVAIKNDGSVWTWGGNAHGQLGNRTATSQPTPQAVIDLSGAIAVAAGNDYTIVLKSDGSVWGAGDNLLGQLGDGSFVGSRRFSPVQDADQAKLFDLAPNQAKSPVPPDQVPIFFMNSEKSGDEVLSATQALGSPSNLSLKSRIRHNGSFAASDAYQLFIAVLVPSGKPGLMGAGVASVPVGADTLFFKNAATSWETYAGGTLPVYMSNVAASEVNSIAMEILANTDLSRMSGAQFYVGYGTSPEEMVAAGRYRIVYQVP